MNSFFNIKDFGGSKLTNNNIIFIGMPGAGKSTIGVVFAKVSGLSFLDTDLYIQQKHNRLLQDIIDKDGIDKFKIIEEEALLEIKVINTLISTGGSAIYCSKAMDYLKSLGIVVYIELSYSNIEKRINNINSRGLVMNKGQTLRDLYNERKPLYEKYADITVNCDGLSLEESINTIQNLFHPT